MDDLSYFEILDAIEFPHTSKRGQKSVVGRMAFSMMFYLRPDGSFSIPERLVNAEEIVREAIPIENYRYWKGDGGTKANEVANNPPKPTREIFNEFELERIDGKTRGAFSFLMWDTHKSGREAPGHHFEYYYQLGDDQPEMVGLDHAATFQVTMPLPWLESQGKPGFIQEFFRAICSELRPYHAVGGLHLSTSLNAGWLQQGAEEFYPFLKKHPGVMHGRAFEAAWGARFRMGPINWLTAIHEDLLSVCGGRSKILKTLGPDNFELSDMPDGLIIQAGPAPQMGDKSENLTIPHYGKLARLLIPARTVFDGKQNVAPAYQIPGTFYEAGWNEDLRREAQLDYLSRFDEM